MKKEELPIPTLTPARGRILVISVAGKKRKLFKGSDKKWVYEDPEVIRNSKTNEKIVLGRFRIVEVGEPEGIVRVKNEDGTYRNPEIGDEIYWFRPMSAVGMDLTLVYDWGAEERFIMFHETELSGAAPWIEVKDDEEED